MPNDLYPISSGLTCFHEGPSCLFARGRKRASEAAQAGLERCTLQLATTGESCKSLRASGLPRSSQINDRSSVSKYCQEMRKRLSIMQPWRGCMDGWMNCNQLMHICQMHADSLRVYGQKTFKSCWRPSIKKDLLLVCELFGNSPTRKLSKLALLSKACCSGRLRATMTRFGSMITRRSAADLPAK